MKKVLALLLSLSLVLMLAPLPSYATEIVASGECGAEPDVLTWQFTDDGTLTISGTGSMKDYSTYSAAWVKLKVKHLIVEEGVSRIGKNAFGDMSYLRTVEIADSVNTIGEYAFANCNNLVSVSLGSGLTSTGSGVFRDCTALEEISFPDTTKSFGGSMFLRCRNLKKVVLSENLIRIPDRAFEGCSSLEHITIPDSVTEIGGSAFKHSGLKEIVVPDGVTEINASTFESCKQLQSVTLSNNLQSMANNVFKNCQVLKTITVPASVMTLAHTFQDAYSLESITFLGNAPKCTSLVFGNLTVTVYYPGNNPSWTELYRENYGGTVTWVPYEADVVWDDVIISGQLGESVNWKLTNTWTLIVSGEGPMILGWPTIPWHGYESRIEHIVIEPGVTTVATGIFGDCRSAQSITIADTVISIESSGFHNCGSVTELVIPASVTKIESDAFCQMLGLKQVHFLGDAPFIEELAFRDVTAEAIYPKNNDTWTKDKMLNYGGTLTWYEEGHVHDYRQVTKDATCTKEGYVADYCDACGNMVIVSRIAHLGHDFSNGVCGEYPICAREGCGYQDHVAVSHKWDDPCSQIRHCLKCGTEDHNGGHTWDSDSASIRGCIICGKIDGGYRLILDMNVGSVYIDGEFYFTKNNVNGDQYVDLPTNTATNMVIYSYSENSDQDGHNYPTGMKVWLLSCEGDYYTATYVPEFENLLQYAGSSIRISGTKGIRMITAIEKDKKQALTGKGLAGYKLVEYGTVLAREMYIALNCSLTLDKSFARSNFAYKRGVADPIFAQTDDLVQYTNVLVGFNLNQCKDDIAMRPYIILEDANGEQITIYGGTVFRSIGYIAYQNRNVFKPGTSSYEYVWEIIHHVYGDKYDFDYQG